jgi:hypothetical protein
MFKADIAEWILSMTTTPERATATAGDLLQESSTRGSLWFWSNLLGAAASLVWRAWVAEPLYLTGLAVRAFLLQAAFLVAAGAGAVLIAAAMIARTIPEDIRVPGGEVGFSVYSAFGGWLILGIVLCFAICQYLLGKYLARRAVHREWAAYLTFLILNRVFWTAVSLWLRLPTGAGLLLIAFFTGIEIVALFAGIERGRRLHRGRA